MNSERQLSCTHFENRLSNASNLVAKTGVSEVAAGEGLGLELGISA